MIENELIEKVNDFAKEITKFNLKEKQIHAEKEMLKEENLNRIAVQKTLVSRGVFFDEVLL